jgi:hypothetical protein
VLVQGWEEMGLVAGTVVAAGRFPSTSIAR